MQLIVIPNENIGEQPCNEKLHSHENAENTNERPKAIADGSMEHDFLREHPQKNSQPDDGKRHTCASEEMERAIGIIPPKPDRDHIDESLHGALPIVLGHAMEARVVRDLHLADTESLELEECWDESVHLSEEIDILKTFTTIRFQAASGIMNLVMYENRSEHIRPAREKSLHEIITTLETPSGYHVIPLIHLCEEKRDIVRIILKVAIDRDDDLSLRCLDTCIESGGLTEILPEHYQLKWCESPTQLERLIPGSIIDKDNFE